MAAEHERQPTRPGSRRRETGRGRATWPLVFVWSLVACQLAAGALYTYAELGELPHYHDSNAYLELARIMRVDAHRGIAYPFFLAVIDLFGAPTFLNVIPTEHPAAACTAPGRILIVQCIQLAACLAAFAFWLRTAGSVGAPGSASGTRTGGQPGSLVAVCALLATDPLIAHLTLSVMPDALAMAASLVFCGALARVALASAPGRPTAWDGILLFASFTVASLVRPERKLVLTAVTLAAAVAWPWLARRGKIALSRFPARMTLAAGLVALGFAGSLATERLMFRDYGRPGQATIILHARVIFPHLGDIFEALPPDIQQRFRPADVAFYDQHVLNPGPVMERVSAGDEEVAEALSFEIARVAWRERGGAIAFDIARDGVENAVPTPAFYARLFALEQLGVPGYREWSRSDMLPWTRKLMAEHHPRLFATASVVSALTFFTLAGWLVWGWAADRRRPREDRERGALPRALLPWLPTAALVLGNAATFALHADAVSPRYNLTAHAVVLALVYTSALRRAKQEAAA